MGHQRVEVLLVERADGVVPHRHGGHRPRRQRRTRACRCSWCRPTRPASNIVRNVGLARRAAGRGLARAHPLRRRARARRRAARRRGPGVRHRPDPPRRRPHPPRHAHDRHGAEGARHDVRAGAQPRDAGQPPGRQAVRAGLHRRLVRPARRSSGCSCSTPRGRSTSTTTTSKVRKDIATVKVRDARRCCTTSPGGRCRCTARSASSNEMPFFGMMPRRRASWASPTARPRSTRSPSPAQVLRGYTAERRPVADRAHPEEAGRGHGRSSPSTSSTRWGTCDRHRPARRPGWTSRASPGRASRSSTATSSGGSQNEIYEIRRGDLHGALRIPPPTAPEPPRRRHPPRVADHRGARRHRRAPHRRRSRVCADPSVLGRTFYLMGFVDGWSPMSIDDWPAPFDTDLEARAGPRLPARRGHRAAVEGRLAGQGPAGPRPARRLPRAPGRPVDRVPRAHQGPRAARLRRGVGVAARAPADRLHPGPHARRLPVRQRDVPRRRARRGWPRSSTGRWAPSATRSSTSAGSCRAGPTTRTRRGGEVAATST